MYNTSFLVTKVSTKIKKLWENAIGKMEETIENVQFSCKNYQTIYNISLVLH